MRNLALVELSERKRHINFFHINFLCRPSSPGLSLGFHRVCPRDKSGEIGLPLCKIRRKPGCVPGFHRICPRDKRGEIPGTRSLGNGVRKNGVRNRVRIDDAGSILKFRIGFPFGENPAGFCKSVWLPESILSFRIGSVSSIGGSIAATLFAATFSDSQREKPGVVPRPTGQKSLCLCAFFLPENY